VASVTAKPERRTHKSKKTYGVERTTERSKNRTLSGKESREKKEEEKKGKRKSRPKHLVWRGKRGVGCEPKKLALVGSLGWLGTP